MKHNQIIYLTAFLLSLSLIFLLETSSLGLLAEDIKPKEKEGVEIELLLSASNAVSEDNSQSGEAERTEKIRKEQEQNELENKEETMNRNAHFFEERKGNNQNQDNMIEKEQLEDKIKTKTKVEEKQDTNKAKPQEELSAEENKEEIESAAESQDEPPAWLKKLESEDKKIEKVSSPEEKEDTAENKRDKFDLEDYLAELEKEDEINNKTKSKQKAEESTLDQKPKNESGKITETEAIRNNTNEEKTENDKSNNFTAAEDNQEIKENKVYDLRTGEAEEIKKPDIKNYSQPKYPSNLRKRNIEGEVIVSLKVDKNGQVHNLKINKSSGFDSFDQAALEAVSNWEFQAAEREGKKVQVIVNLPIRFELN